MIHLGLEEVYTYCKFIYTKRFISLFEKLVINTNYMTMEHVEDNGTVKIRKKVWLKLIVLNIRLVLLLPRDSLHIKDGWVNWGRVYLLATYLQNFMVRNAINSKLWYFCRSYPIKLCYFSVVPILCKIILCLLDIVIRPICINYKKVFELVLTGDNTKKKH